MIKLEIDREVLHQITLRAGGGRPAQHLGIAGDLAIRDAARKIAAATDVPERGPVEIVVTN